MENDSKLTHVNAKGEASMVDVGAKEVTQRSAKSESWILVNALGLAQVRDNTAKKGDILGTARIAGIMAAKRCHELIPLCHPLKIVSVNVELELVSGSRIPDVVLQLRPNAGGAFRIQATVKAFDQTGVEMEALTASSVAALTVYDMLKAVDREMVVGPTHLLEKHGGKSGDFTSEPYRR